MRKSIAFGLVAALVLSTMAPLASMAQNTTKPSGTMNNAAAPAAAPTVAPSKTNKPLVFRSGNSARHRHFHRNAMHRTGGKSPTWNKRTAQNTRTITKAPGTAGKPTAATAKSGVTSSKKTTVNTTHKSSGTRHKSTRTTGRHVA